MQGSSNYHMIKEIQEIVASTKCPYSKVVYLKLVSTSSISKQHGINQMLVACLVVFFVC